MVVRRCGQLTSSYNGSLGRRQASLESIPLDIMHLIADHSLAEDMVALSTVSKPLRDLLSDRSIWKKMYARSTLFLPPGPYEWQSTSYLINTLSRARKFRSVWPSLVSRREIIRTRYLRLVVTQPSPYFWAGGSLSRRGQFSFATIHIVAIFPILPKHYLTLASVVAFFVYSLLDVYERMVSWHLLCSYLKPHWKYFHTLCKPDGVLKGYSTIAKVLMDREKPSNIQTVFISTPIGVDGWTGLINARLYHCLLVVNIGEYSSDWESSGRLVIMDIDTLRRYHIPASTDDMAFDPMHIVTYFFTNKTYFVKVMVSSRNNEIRSKVESFLIPTSPETRENDVLYPSHRGQVAYSLGMRECTVIHESPADSETGKILFALCGLVETCSSDCNALKIREVCLEPDGSISLTTFGLTEGIVTSFGIGLSRQHKCGVALTRDKRPFLFALDYHWPGSVLSKWSILDHTFPSSELLALDAFRGTAFFSRRSSHHTVAEMVDFTHDVHKGEGRSPGAQFRPSHRG